MKDTLNHLEKNSFKFWQIYLSLFSGYFSTNSRENYFDEDTDVQGYTFIETLSRLKGEDYLKTVSVYQDASTKRFIVKRLQYKRKNIPYAQLKNEANIIYLFSKKATEDLFPGVRFCQFVDFYEKKGDVYLIREFVSGETLDNLPEENKLEYLSKSLEFLSNAKSSLSQREIEKISYRSNWLILISCPVYFLGAVLKEVRLLRDFTQLFLIFIVNFPYKSLISPFYVLTHRDLHLKNIIFNGEEIVIIDPEICVFAEKGLELAMAGVSYKKNQGSLFLKLLFEKNIASVEMKNTFRAFSSYYIFQELLLSRRKTQSYLDIKKYLIDFNDTVHLLPTTLLK